MCAGARSTAPLLPSGALLFSKAEFPRAQLFHDLFGAAADHQDLDFAVKALAHGAAHEAHAAENLHGGVGTELHGLGGVVLEQADLANPFRSLVAHIGPGTHRIDPGDRKSTR